MNKSIKKIWLVCLCLAGLCLAGCFHVPNKDWLPSKNKVDSWENKKNDEMQQAVDSFVEWVDMFSSQRGEMKDNENVENEVVELDEPIIETEDEAAKAESENWEMGDVINE